MDVELSDEIASKIESAELKTFLQTFLEVIHFVYSNLVIYILYVCRNVSMCFILQCV